MARTWLLATGVIGCPRSRLAFCVAQENGANLAACTEPSRPDTMDVRVSVPITGPFAFLGDAKGQARAGAPDDTGGE